MCLIENQRVQDESGNPRIVQTVMCDAYGHFFNLRTAFDFIPGHRGFPLSNALDRSFEVHDFGKRFSVLLRGARSFYAASGIERPGLVSVQIGAKGIHGLTLYESGQLSRPHPYGEDDYVDEMIIRADEFLSEDAWSSASAEFAARLAYSFDVRTEYGI
jgi:hypothetical protein